MSVKERLDEIALLALMCTDTDSQGVEMLHGMVSDLVAECDASQKQIKQAFTELLKDQAKAPSVFLQDLSEILKSAVAYLSGDDSVAFPSDAEKSAPTSNPDLSNNIDKSLLTELVETHTLLLDEFEGSLLDFSPGYDQNEAPQAAKRYLHNLKGDSGSVGLIGVEKVCHKLEDLVLERPFEEMVGTLLLFKEWASAYLRSMAKGQTPSEDAASFLSRLSILLGLPAKRVVKAEPPTPPIPAPKKDLTDEYSLTGETDIFVEFSAEAEEHLLSVEDIVLNNQESLEKPEIDKLFRAVHSLKGGSAYFTFSELTVVSHTLENILDEVRNGKRAYSPTLAALVLRYIDLSKQLLASGRAAIQAGTPIKPSAKSQQLMADLKGFLESGTSAPQPEAEPSSTLPSAQDGGETQSSGEKLNVKSFVKIDTNRLDHLIDSVGEMVIYSSILIRLCRNHLGSNQAALEAAGRVEKFARDLQDVAMGMRLVPIKGLFQKMSRLVWDTSKKLGKQISFEMIGEDTELDRNLIDKLADPLMHMVRNSLDHGVETPDDRQKAGKSPKGTVKLSAYHAGGSIHVTVEDDGKGLDKDRILAKAIEKGVVNSAQNLSDDEIYQLIFAPGFSTAAVVTDISGRGVGMDVVRRNVESLRGRIQIASTLGKGSKFTIELPLTLAIIDGIQVSVGHENFIIPSYSILEFIKPTRDSISRTLDCCETLEFRGSYLPIFRLSKVYNIGEAAPDLMSSTLVIVENNGEQAALVVDSIVGEFSTVIKNLGPMFREGTGLAGCAIMPDGDVSIILDVPSLVRTARHDYTWKTPQLPSPSEVVH